MKENLQNISNHENTKVRMRKTDDSGQWSPNRLTVFLSEFRSLGFRDPILAFIIRFSYPLSSRHVPHLSCTARNRPSPSSAAAWPDWRRPWRRWNEVSTSNCSSRPRHWVAGPARITTIQADQLVDLSPHVAMGCCTNLLDFCRRTETADGFDRYATLHFFGPDGTRYDFTASRWLPAPLHLMPGLRRLGYLTGSQRRAIGRAMLRLARHRQPDAADGADHGPVAPPAEATGKRRAAVLGRGAGKRLGRHARSRVGSGGAKSLRRWVHGHARVLRGPRPPDPVGRNLAACRHWLTRRGAKLHMRTRIERLEVDGNRFLGIVLGDGLCRRFDHVVSAVSWKQLGKLLGPELLKQIPRGRGRHRAELVTDHGGASLVRSADHGPAACRLGRPAEPMGVPRQQPLSYAALVFRGRQRW